MPLAMGAPSRMSCLALKQAINNAAVAITVLSNVAVESSHIRSFRRPLYLGPSELKAEGTTFAAAGWGHKLFLTGFLRTRDSSELSVTGGSSTVPSSNQTPRRRS